MMENVLIKDDCKLILPTIEDNSIDLICSDLPYGITSAKFDIPIPLEFMWEQFNRILKPNGGVVLTASQPFSSMLVMSNLKMYKHEWIWVKNRGSNFANTVREGMKEHEQVLFFSKGGWTFNKQMQERSEGGKSRIQYDFNTVTESENYRKFERPSDAKGKQLRVPSSVQKFNIVVGKERKHPQQKPIELMEYMIKTYSNENDLVLDITMGVGTTCLAAKNLKRRYIGIENEQRFYDEAVLRLK